MNYLTLMVVVLRLAVVTSQWPLLNKSDSIGIPYIDTKSRQPPQKRNTSEDICSYYNNPCYHGGTCYNLESYPGYYCSCSEGYTGRDCLDYLGPQPTIPGRFTSSETTKENPCSHYMHINPCFNGGTCQYSEYYQGFHCICPQDYTGKSCRDKIVNTTETVPMSTIPVNNVTSNEDPCSYYDYPCYNGGTCHRWEYNPGYYCSCPTGFSGSNCLYYIGTTPSTSSQSTEDICSNRNNPCYNGGTCHYSEYTRGYYCSCPVGYYGRHCRYYLANTTEKVRISTIPVSNVTSNEDPCSYYDYPCYNGGTCHRWEYNPAGYYCSCPIGFSGSNCLYYIGTTPSASYSQSTEDICSYRNNPCYNGGTCHYSEYSRGYYCSCPVGYYGRHCRYYLGNTTDKIPISTIPVNNVTSNEDPCSYYDYPCYNGGTCHRWEYNPAGYYCSCPIGFSGSNCLYYIGTTPSASTEDICLYRNNPCYNGGTCHYSEYSRGYYCSCPVGYYGRHCRYYLGNTTNKILISTIPVNNVTSNEDPCSYYDYPCYNGGTCHRWEYNPAGYYCSCPIGFSGSNCLYYIGTTPSASTEDICSYRNNPCYNGGTCHYSEYSRGYYCSCPVGYYGRHCRYYLGSSTNKIPTSTIPVSNVTSNEDPCSYYDYPCYNGGTCHRWEYNPAGYYCSCPIGFSGSNCLYYIVTTPPTSTEDICSYRNNPCYNGGTCHYSEYSRGYYCSCPVGYYGRHCRYYLGSTTNKIPISTIPVNNVTSNEDPCSYYDYPCYNGGTCHRWEYNPAGYYCSCPIGFSGSNCLYYIGTTPSASYSQSTEDICSYRNNPCYNGGTCHYSEYTRGYYCSCPVGYYGRHCRYYLGTTPLTTSFPAKNVTAKDDPCSYYNYTCKNGGTCHYRGFAGFYCSCPVGYYGWNCGYYIVIREGTKLVVTSKRVISTEDICSYKNKPCLNGSTCHYSEYSRGYYCSCPVGYYGRHCRYHQGNTTKKVPISTIPVNNVTSNKDPCSYYDYPCYNGGTCHRWEYNPAGYYCSCPTGFSGTNCLYYIGTTPSASYSKSTEDICSYKNNPCHNGGTCHFSENSRGYYCSCPVGYYGRHCRYYLGTTPSTTSLPTQNVTENDDPCSYYNYTCYNGGACYHDKYVGFYCNCPSDYYGWNCQHYIGRRTHNSTKAKICPYNNLCNNGMCHYLEDSIGFYCKCPPDYYGDQCQYYIVRKTTKQPYNPSTRDMCLRYKRLCYNGGSCHHTKHYPGYYCSCPSGYTGVNCLRLEIKTTKQPYNPATHDMCLRYKPLCYNGGSCQHTEHYPGYYCSCPSGYTGANCKRLAYSSNTNYNNNNGIDNNHHDSFKTPLIVVSGTMVAIVVVLVVIVILLKIKQRRQRQSLQTYNLLPYTSAPY